MIKKQLYEAPATEVLELRLEGTVLAGSSLKSQDNQGITWGGYYDDPE